MVQTGALCPAAPERDKLKLCRRAMLLRLRLLVLSVGGGLLLLLILCLGAQNLNDRHSIRLGSARSVPLPSGFLVGVSLVLGVISGGTTLAVLMPERQDWP